MRSLKSNDGDPVSPVLVVGLVLVIVVPLVFFFWSGGWGEQSPQPAGPVDSTAATTSAMPVIPDTSTTTSDASASTQETQVNCEEATELEFRVQCFVDAWYLLSPDDSTETKRARVEPYASELFMEQNADAMEVYTDTMADQARITSKETMSGEVSGEILFEPDQEHEELMRVFVTVTLSEQTPSSAATPYLRLFAEMMWSYTDGVWRIESIRDLGGV